MPGESRGRRPRRSRSGGIAIVSSLSLKKRSRRNRFSLTSCGADRRFVATIMRRSTGTSFSPPTRRSERSSSTFSSSAWARALAPRPRRGRACRCLRFSNLPACCRSAPVNEPRSCPNSSESSSVSGRLAQFVCTNGPFSGGERPWIRRAGERLARPALAREQHGDVGLGAETMRGETSASSALTRSGSAAWFVGSAGWCHQAILGRMTLQRMAPSSAVISAHARSPG